MARLWPTMASSMCLVDMIWKQGSTAMRLTFILLQWAPGQLVPIWWKLWITLDMPLMAVDSMRLEDMMEAHILRTLRSTISQPMFGVLTMAQCFQEELHIMPLPSWMVVCIPLEGIILHTTIPHTWLPPSVECMPSVDHVMMRTNALSMTPVKAMVNVLERLSAL